MGRKQKKPLQKDPPGANAKPEPAPKGRRGIEPEEQHRQSGHRVSDKGGGGTSAREIETRH